MGFVKFALVIALHQSRKEGREEKTKQGRDEGMNIYRERGREGRGNRSTSLLLSVESSGVSMFEVRLHDTDSPSNRHVCARTNMSVRRESIATNLVVPPTLHDHHHHHDYHVPDDGLCHSKWSLLLLGSCHGIILLFSSHFLVIILKFFISFWL